MLDLVVERRLKIANHNLEEKLENEMVEFNGVDLAREEYYALQKIAQKYGKGKTVEDYFDSHSDEDDVYLEIKDGHVIRLDMTGQDVKEIPSEVKKLKKLRLLYLGQNNISQLRDLHLPHLEYIDLYNNKITCEKNESIISRLHEKGVGVIIESKETRKTEKY